MAKLLFKLYGVPDDEILDVRELCETHEFEVYETEMGRWGIGIAAIWLRNEDQYERAREVLNEYQNQRFENAQEDRREVEKLTLLQGLYIKFKQDPNAFFLSLISMLLILGLSVYPFLNLF